MEKECKLLANFGDKICQMLDKKLQDYVSEYGTTEPVEGYLHIPYLCKIRKTKNQKSKARATAAIQNGSDSTTVSKIKNSAIGQREYIPQYRSGPYALLITLYSQKQAGISDMSKRELMNSAQYLSEKSFTVPDPGSRYTAWSSMGSLIKKGLVNKSNSPAKYSLSAAGCALAVRLQEFALSGEPSHSKALSGEPCHSKNYPLLNPDQNLLNCYEDKNDKDEVLTVRDKSRNGLSFHYIDEAGNEVLHKDAAAVTIDDEIALAFLIKCSYEDLLMSGKQYKLDTSRYSSGDDIFAFLRDQDAPEFSTKSGTKNSDGHLSNHSVENKQETCLSSRVEYTCQMNKKGNSLTTLSKRVEPQHSLKGSQQLSNDQFFLPKLKKSGQSIASLTDDSQSIASVSCDSQSEAADPDFILKPGTFHIILCVDNQEFYGGGTDKKKQMMVNELQRHQVPHEIRPLHIGDFCWVARDKTDKRELVLDYIVERKRMDDLAGSIIDGRFREQKFRMRNCGLLNPIYLVEDYGSNQHLSIGEDALFQAITNTQIIDNFYVKRTSDTRESATYLTLMTRYLQSLHANKTLCAVSKSSLDKLKVSIDAKVTSKRINLMTFDEFNEASVKSRALTVREMFGKQLCQLHSLTAEKAAAILEHYPTPTSLIRAYRQCGSDKEKEAMLSNIKFGVTHRNIGMALSKTIYFMYNTTEAS